VFVFIISENKYDNHDVDDDDDDDDELARRANFIV